MTQLSKEFRNHCEAVSVEWRIKLGLRAFDPLPANMLAEACSVLIRSPEQLALSHEVQKYFRQQANWWGILFPTTPPIIVYNPNQSPARYESTVMHELAHLLLKHPPQKVYLTTVDGNARNYNSQLEAEAAYLGSCLQIPRRGLYWAVQKGLSNEEIASYFNASQAMVQWRQNTVNAI